MQAGYNIHAGQIPNWHASLNLNSGGIGMELWNSTLFNGGSYSTAVRFKALI